MAKLHQKRKIETEGERERQRKRERQHYFLAKNSYNAAHFKVGSEATLNNLKFILENALFERKIYNKHTSSLAIDSFGMVECLKTCSNACYVCAHNSL